MGGLDNRYEAWNEALTAEYFPLGNSGRLAYLPVDDEELAAMAPRYGLCGSDDAVRDFIKAVKSELWQRGFEQRGFERPASTVAGWRRVRASPPYIGLLAFCVLAGSRMQAETEHGISSTNYYTQLNRLLGFPDRAGAPRGFDRLGGAWRDLERWLEIDCTGERGGSTIRTSERWRHVGYPLSQCLLRAVDRRRLPDFFRAAVLTPSSEISAFRLFTLLRAWAAQPACGLSARARAAIEVAVDIDLDEIAETVERELRAWDGELRDERGRRRAPIHLYVIPRGRRPAIVSLIPRRPTGYPAGTWGLDGTPSRLELVEHHADGWFAPLNLPLTGRILENGLSLVRGDLSLRFEPADALPCRQAEIAIGGYLSQPSSVMWEPHIALARRTVKDDLSALLSRHTPERPPDLSANGLPSGWSLIGPFRLTTAPQDPPARFARFAPRMFSATSLDGGLRLSEPQLTPPIYLSGGGEPDVQISVEPGHDLAVVLDGVEHPLRDGALELALSEMDLPEGEHELIADVTRRFTTRNGFRDMIPPGAGSMGYRLACHGSYQPESLAAEPLPDREPPRGWVYVSGAVATGRVDDLPLGDRRPLLVRAGRRRLHVIGAGPGEVVDAPSDPPHWLTQLKQPSADGQTPRTSLADFVQFVELEPPFEPMWLLTESGDGTRRAEPLASPAARPNGASDPRWAGLIRAWSDAVVDSACTETWTDYVAAARSTGAGS